MNNKSTNKTWLITALFMLALAAAAAAQTFRQGNTVETPDGRTGVIESFRNETMAKVRFSEAADDTRYFMLKDLKIVEAPKPPRTTPVESFRVGDIVINPKNPNRQLSIDSISGDTAVVRYGPGNYNLYKAKFDELVSLRVWEEMQNRENEQELLRQGFKDDAAPYMTTVNLLAHTYDKKFQQGGGSFISNAATYEEWRKDLEALAGICRKYPNMTNGDLPTYMQDTISHNPADICRMVDQRTSLLQKMKNKVGDMSADNEVRSWIYKLNESTSSSEGWMEDELQMLLFERAAWETKYLKNLKKKYTDTGAVMSPDVLQPLDEFVAPIKTNIEAGSALRNWEEPNASDAALEALAKRRVAIDFPGSQVLKTGMTYGTWKSVDTKSLVGTANNWKFYKINPGAYRYKLGLALVKMPNRPQCQIREFQVTQHKAGGGFGPTKVWVGGAGIFVKCP